MNKEELIKKILKEMNIKCDKCMFHDVENIKNTNCECCNSKNLRRAKFEEKDKFMEGSYWWNMYFCEDCGFTGMVNEMDFIKEPKHFWEHCEECQEKIKISESAMKLLIKHFGKEFLE
jgi:hypothetical protein